MMLAFAPFGVQLIVKNVVAQGKTKRHLDNLGLIQGVKLLSLYDMGGDVIIKIGSAKLALSKSVAMKIYVEKEA